MAQRIVGIDLGTTNTVVAWWEEGAGVRVFEVPQLVARGEVAPRELLPSVLFAPPDGEATADPYAAGGSPWIGGTHAKRRATEVPSRGVVSAKSWLCHARVDRTAAILPWTAGAEEATDVPRISPLDASAHVLAHVRRAWDEAFPEAPLAEQEVVLTIPASFDEVARQLTLEAAKRAGLAPRLCEEPQAAFYDFLQTRSAKELAAWVDGAGGELATLVCDVGGGTTDLSLLRLRSEHGEVAIDRVAVGRHLLVGGDNMDLALAHRVEPRIAPGGKLDPARFAELVLACRDAKERLLAEDAPAEVTVTLLSAGSRLVGGSLRATLARSEAEEVVLAGFFPDPRGPGPRARAGLVAFGLPYESDVAITRHVRAFLERHRAGGLPRALLVNGGVFHAAAARARLALALDEWLLDGSSEVQPLEVLPNDAPDLAVARGAVAFGLALRGRGPRIGGGSARAFYVGVSSEDGAARAACLLPRGAREGDVHRGERAFGLVIGRPVRFDLFSSDDAPLERPGALVDPKGLDRLSPAFVRFDGPVAKKKRAPEGAIVDVTLEASLSAVGTLEMRCAENAGEKRTFEVTFELRGEPPAERAPARAASGKTDAAVALVAAAFRGEEHARTVKDLARALEKTLGERDEWPTDTLRALADELLAEPRARRRSADSERVFWSLLGWCQRPGFGDPGDEARMRRVAPLFAEKLAHPEPRSEQQFFIALRRMAGGFEERGQVAMRDALDPFVAPAEAKLKKPKGFRPQGEAEVIELLAWLERVPVARRVELGGWLLERTWTSRDPRIWAALGRIGARRPAYASLHHVIGVPVAERWLDHLLREKWDDLPTAARAATELARRTGDRARDVSDGVRAEVLRRLAKQGAPERWIEAVRDVVETDAAERSETFGDRLPLGLRVL